VTALWIVPLLFFVIGALGMARLVNDLTRSAAELRLVMAHSDELRAATRVVRSDMEATRGSFGKLQQR
jgi:hypothetical protein